MAKINLDKVGACASAICAVHCLLTGVALGLLSFVGLGFLGNTWVDYLFIGVAVSVGSFAVFHGITHHKSYVPASFFVLGILAVLWGHFGFGHSHEQGVINPYSTVVSVFGGICLVMFHFLNWRLQKARRCCGEGKICTHPDNREQIA